MPDLMKAPKAPAPGQESAVTIPTRLTNAGGAPEAWEGIQKLLVAVQKGGLPAEVQAFTHMRASQINGCSACIEGTIRHANKRAQKLDDRLLAVAAWRHSSLFTAAERAALDLAEEMTRLADRADPVPDHVWEAAAQHFDEKALSALVLHIALTNFFNRLNVATRQPAGDW